MSKYGIKSSKQSEKDLERLHKAFQRLDTNKDGTIDIEEFVAALNPNVDLKGFLQHDENKDGKIDFQEFVKYAENHQDKLRLHFDSMDTNHDGKIQVEEVVAVFKRLGTNMTRDDATKLLGRMDKDGDYTIDWSEWRDYLLLTPTDRLEDLLTYWKRSTIIDIGDNTTIPDDFTEKEMQTGMWWRQLVSGGVAGAVSRTCTAPLDRLKILLQVHGSSKNNLTIASGFKQMLKDGGYRSLWRGNGINVIKIAPESAIKFMAYDQLKRLFRGNSNREVTGSERFAAGSLAGAFSQTLIYPMEVLKTRLALRKTGQYSSIADCAYKIFKHQGAGAFFRGYIPNIIGIMPYAGIDLAIYETLKNLWLEKKKDQDPGVLVLLACGTTSSTCGQLVTYPLALIRTRMQAEGKGKQSTMSTVFKKIWREDGLRGFYRGLGPNFLKVAPAVGISYVVYEKVSKQLGVRAS